MSQYHRAAWESTPFRFQAGDVSFVRHFAERTPDKRRQLALDWATDKGYTLLGPAPRD